MVIVKLFKTYSLVVRKLGIMDKRTYIRIIFDKLLRDNIVFVMFDKFVKFYCAIFSHPINSLKFKGSCPLKNNEVDMKISFQDIEKTKSILG